MTTLNTVGSYSILLYLHSTILSKSPFLMLNPSINLSATAAIGSE